MMNDPTLFLPLKTAELHILVALAEGERHGYALMQAITQSSEGRLKVGPATLYGTLKRLVSAGLIEETAAKADRERDDERRRYYRLSQLGRTVLAAELERLARIVDLARERRLIAAAGAVPQPEGGQ